MRLWHQKLIHYLPDAQLLGLHREVCQLRHTPYKEWSKQSKNGMVGYVFKYDNSLLYQYHLLVLGEMQDRGMEPDPDWYNRLSADVETTCWRWRSQAHMSTSREASI